jgi:hypothetical protein
MFRKKLIFLAAGILILAALPATLAGIQAAPDTPAASYTVPWWTVDSGGGTSQGGPYILSGTAGQPEPGNLSGGNYLLKGGFWSELLDYTHYLPLLAR